MINLDHEAEPISEKPGAAVHVQPNGMLSLVVQVRIVWIIRSNRRFIGN